MIFLNKRNTNSVFIFLSICCMSFVFILFYVHFYVFSSSLKKIYFLFIFFLISSFLTFLWDFLTKVFQVSRCEKSTNGLLVISAWDWTPVSAMLCLGYEVQTQVYMSKEPKTDHRDDALNADILNN